MNKLLNERYVAVEGLDNALEMAKMLIKNDYQVMVQLDDCDIYIVAFTENTTEFGDKFTPLSFEEIDMIEDNRLQEKRDDSFWQDECDKLETKYDNLLCEYNDLDYEYCKLQRAFEELVDKCDEYFDDYEDDDDEDFDDDEDDDEEFNEDEDDFDDEEDED